MMKGPQFYERRLCSVEILDVSRVGGVFVESSIIELLYIYVCETVRIIRRDEDA